MEGPAYFDVMKQKYLEQQTANKLLRNNLVTAFFLR